MLLRQRFLLILRHHLALKVSLQHKVKIQYLEIHYIVYTSIWCLIFHWSTSIVKRCMYIMFQIVDTAFSSWQRIDHLLITSGIFQDKRKCSVCDLKCRYYVFSFVGRFAYRYIQGRVWGDGLFHNKRRQWVPNRLKNNSFFHIATF